TLFLQVSPDRQHDPPAVRQRRASDLRALYWLDSPLQLSIIDPQAVEVAVERPEVDRVFRAQGCGVDGRTRPLGFGRLITPDVLARFRIQPVEAAVARAEEDRTFPISGPCLDPRLGGEAPVHRLPSLVEAIEMIVLAAEEDPVIGHDRFPIDPALCLERP